MTGEIINIMGDGRYGIKCDDGIKRIGLLRGKLRRIINPQLGVKVDIELRDFEPFKCDIRCKV